MSQAKDPVCVAPKFGSAASGGLEHEATPERHEEKPARRKK